MFGQKVEVMKNQQQNTKTHTHTRVNHTQHHIELNCGLGITSAWNVRASLVITTTAMGGDGSEQQHNFNTTTAIGKVRKKLWDSAIAGTCIKGTVGINEWLILEHVIRSPYKCTHNRTDGGVVFFLLAFTFFRSHSLYHSVLALPFASVFFAFCLPLFSLGRASHLPHIHTVCIVWIFSAVFFRCSFSCAIKRTLRMWTVFLLVHLCLLLYASDSIWNIKCNEDFNDRKYERLSVVWMWKDSQHHFNAMSV